jgi:flagellin-like protein
MKGITPVIAVILLLLITVSMAGFAFVFLQRSLESATEATGEGIQQELLRQGQKVVIVTGAGTSVTLRASGTQAIPVGSVALLVNNTATTSGNCPAVQQAAGSIFSCTSTVAVCNGNADPTTRSDLVVNAPGGTDATSC